jgi:DNA-binding MarR family transcriptional regulator
MSSEDLQPDLNSVRIFEEDGRQYRVYLTRSGQIACDRFDRERKTWVHLALRMLTEQELGEILAVRYAHGDEEIARAVAAAQKT